MGIKESHVIQRVIKVISVCLLIGGCASTFNIQGVSPDDVKPGWPRRAWQIEASNTGETYEVIVKKLGPPDEFIGKSVTSDGKEHITYLFNEHRRYLKPPSPSTPLGMTREGDIQLGGRGPTLEEIRILSVLVGPAKRYKLTFSDGKLEKIERYID